MANELRQKNKWWRTIQYLVAYLVGAWTFLQFVDWFLIRYEISPYWVDILLWIFVGLIPSLLILIHNQERISQGIVKLREKIIIPINILMLSFGIYLAFGNSDLGATTKEVDFANKFGDIEKKTITKEEFRIGVPLFDFEQTEGDSTTVWMANIINELLNYDLNQDKNLTATTYGASSTIDKVNITKVFHEFYVDGKFEKTDTGYKITPEIRKSKNGNLIKSQVFEGTNYLSLLDDISIFIRENIGIIKEKREQYIDLNIADFITSNLEALEEYYNGNYEEATDLDPSFALAYYQNAKRRIRYSQGQLEEQEIISKSYNNSRKLPYQLQLEILISRHIAYNQWNDAKELLNLQLEIDPFNEEYKNLMYIILGHNRDTEGIFEYAKSNFEKNTNLDTSYDYYNALLVSNKFDLALDLIRQYELLDPGNSEAASAKIKPYLFLENSEEAEKIIKQTELVHLDLKYVTDDFNSALNYLKKKPNKFKEFSKFLGVYRSNSTEQTTAFFLVGDKLKVGVTNQKIAAILKASDSLLLRPEFENALTLRYKFLNRSKDEFYAFDLEQQTYNSNGNFRYWKRDSLIEKAENLFLEYKIDEARKAYELAIQKNPEHYYLKSALEHINYTRTIDSVKLIEQYAKHSGQFGPRKFWTENGKFYYKRKSLPKTQLYPIDNNTYLNLSRYDTQIGFIEEDKETFSIAYSYDIETDSWAINDNENNKFKRNK